MLRLHQVLPKLKLKLPFFSTTSPARQLTDWQYTNKIHQSLQQNDINEALRYLINSHLDNKVLDMHIYRNYFTKVQKLKLELSYQQMGYILYREYFKPNILILDWMQSLVRTKNDKVKKMLVNDFQLLNIKMPVGKNQQQENLKEKHKQKVENKETKEKSVKQHHKQFEISSILENKEDLTNSQNLQKLTTYLQISNGIKSLVQPILGNNPKLTFYNVQIEYDHGQQNNIEQGQNRDTTLFTVKSEEDYNNDDDDNDEHESDDIEEQFIDGQDSWIKKIKIGKIQMEIGIKQNLHKFDTLDGKDGKDGKNV